MSTRDPRLDDRLMDLLSDRALDGLDATEAAELAHLLAQRPERDPDVLDRAATAAMLASFPGGEGSFEPMPAYLAERVLDGARLQIQSRDIDAQSGRRLGPAIAAAPKKKTDFVRWTGFMAAAACLALAVGAFYRPRAGFRGATSTAKASAELFADMLADKTALHAKFDATEDPAAKGASGDMVWSASAQKGFMRFRGLAANDKTRTQYQLWIFDDAQDARYPVDGGVFDVDAVTGDVIVPITAKIAVVRPTLFAVTIEKPGGVVVSKREHIVVTAKPV